jgi:CHAT domain-containing protein
VRARVLERDFAKYRFVHIAAHAVVDAEIPSLSSLVLGAFDRNGRVEDQQIRVGDLLDKRFTADLVVLSACNTSVGRSYAQEGPLGMHYAVLARGARAVVASLWPVADETNTELMTELYRRMVKRGERVDIAFAGAMRTQIAAHPDRDPVFWATYNTYAID